MTTKSAPESREERPITIRDDACATGIKVTKALLGDGYTVNKAMEVAAIIQTMLDNRTDTHPHTNEAALNEGEIEEHCETQRKACLDLCRSDTSEEDKRWWFAQRRAYEDILHRFFGHPSSEERDRASPGKEVGDA